jgi:DNA invertase Pin-like site-specific DNA recombinase
MAFVYSYIRFSSGKQARGSSVARQTDLANAWRARHPEHTLNTTLRMRDLGKSAFRGANLDPQTGDLGKFIWLAEHDKKRVPPGSILLLEKLDRFTRDDSLKAVHVLSGLILADITVITLDPERVADRKTAGKMEILLPMVLDLIMANEYSANLSTRVSKGWAAKRQRAIAGEVKMTSNCPLWLRYNPAKHTYDKLHERVAIVKRIFNLADNGAGSTVILGTTGLIYEAWLRLKALWSGKPVDNNWMMEAAKDLMKLAHDQSQAAGEDINHPWAERLKQERDKLRAEAENAGKTPTPQAPKPMLSLAPTMAMVEKLQQLTLTAEQVAQNWEKNDPVTKAVKSFQDYAIAVEEGSVSMIQFKQMAVVTQSEILGFSDAFETLDQRMILLGRAYNAGVISLDQYYTAVRKAREELLGFSDPIGAIEEKQKSLDLALRANTISVTDYKKAMYDATKSALGLADTPEDNLKDYQRQVDNLGRAWQRGKITVDEYWATVQKLQQEKLGVSSTPEQQINTYLQKLNALDAALHKPLNMGGITKDQYNEAAKNAIPDFVKDLTEKTRTPIEKFAEEMQQLDKWKPYISPDLYNRTMQGYVKDMGFDKTNLASASEYGTAEARTAILNARFQGESSPQAQLVNLAKQQLDETKRQTEAIQKQGGQGTVIMRLP